MSLHYLTPGPVEPLVKSKFRSYINAKYFLDNSLSPVYLSMLSVQLWLQTREISDQPTNKTSPGPLPSTSVVLFTSEQTHVDSIFRNPIYTRILPYICRQSCFITSRERLDVKRKTYQIISIFLVTVIATACTTRKQCKV